MDAIKRSASALIVERLNHIGDVTQNFSSEGDASQFFHARILAREFRRALMMWIPLTHVPEPRSDRQNDLLTRRISQGCK